MTPTDKRIIILKKYEPTSAKKCFLRQILGYHQSFSEENFFLLNQKMTLSNKVASTIGVVIQQAHVLVTTYKNLAKRCEVNTVKFIFCLAENRNVTHTQRKIVNILFTAGFFSEHNNIYCVSLFQFIRLLLQHLHQLINLLFSSETLCTPLLNLFQTR